MKINKQRPGLASILKNIKVCHKLKFLAAINNEFFNWAITDLFFIFAFSTVNSNYVHYKILPMTGFELRTSSIGSDRSAN